MSDLSLFQFVQFLSLYLPLDVAETLSWVYDAMTIGSLCGALWGGWVGARFSWRSAAWVVASLLAGLRAYGRYRVVMRRAREIARREIADEAMRTEAMRLAKLDEDAGRDEILEWFHREVRGDNEPVSPGTRKLDQAWGTPAGGFACGAAQP